MVRMKDRNHAPVGGWIVAVPEIANQHIVRWDFKSAGDALWDLLRSNPGVTRRFPHLPQTRSACDEYVDTRNAQRMLTIKHAQTYIAQDAPAPKVRPLQQVIASGRKLAAGAVSIASWLGDGGKPVPQVLADKRADICTKCPQNQTGSLETWFTEPATNMIRKMLGQRDGLGLKTAHDTNLNVCAACQCPLKLKVHIPINYITSKLQPAQRNALDVGCWILSESK